MGNERAAGVCRRLHRPGIDDLYLDEGAVRKYLHKELFQSGVEPEQVASRALLEAARLAGAAPDAGEFADSMRAITDGMFYGLEELQTLYDKLGETSLSARHMCQWAIAKREDPNSVLFQLNG
jgi:hypothetical protein